MKRQVTSAGETDAFRRMQVELLDAENEPLEQTGSLAPRVDVEITDGTACIFSDCHHDPRYPASTAHRAIVLLAQQLKPDLIIENGDLVDCPTVSRHPRIMFEERPKLVDELACGQKRMREIERAAPKAQLAATFGNHCSRTSSYIAANAPALEGLPGTRTTSRPGTSVGRFGSTAKAYHRLSSSIGSLAGYTRHTTTPGELGQHS